MSTSSTQIHKIDARSVHQICSGQVITDQISGMKELVENSLDAGASNIEVVFYEYGSMKLEVKDNGVGISKSNFPTLGHKHCTSKQTRFEDLQFVHSLGFRGEALSSQCGVANLEICTRTNKDDVGTCLIFDETGHIVSENPMAREIGTTVIIQDLFHSLPVRRVHFLKEKKNVYTSAISLLQKYAIGCPSVRFRCTHMIGKKLENVFTTPGCMVANTSTSMQYPLTAQYQEKYLSQLEMHELHDETEIAGVKFSGFISKLQNGRNSNDRQCLWLNGRLVDIPALTKGVSDVYQRYSVGGGVYNNNGSLPCIYQHMTIPSTMVDINVTPNKRTVFLKEEARIIAMLKTLLAVYYEGKENIITLKPIQSFFVDTPSITTTPTEEVILVNEVKKRTSDTAIEPAMIKKEKLQIQSTSQINVSLSSILHLYNKQYNTPFKVVSKNHCNHTNHDDPLEIGFHADVDSTTAEAKLTQSIHISEFKEMHSVGQFNRGFLIANQKGNCFIVDQHAADEKSTYERQKGEKLGGQKLIIPQKMHISAEHRQVLEQHQAEVEALGFLLDIQPEYVFILKKPQFKGLLFSEADIVDICSQQMASPHTPPIQKRQDAAHASKACRTSVMVGDELHISKQTSILKRLSELRMPWSCPHGRPTLRHLIDLRELPLHRMSEELSETVLYCSVTSSDRIPNHDSPKDILEYI